MPLINFGSILSFTEELEKQVLAFYSDAAINEACLAYSDFLSVLIQKAQRNIKTIQRTRRENVTEIILENTEGFARAPYCLKSGLAVEMIAAEVLETDSKLEDRLARYYTAAADKLKAQWEVVRALKLIDKKNISRLEKIKAL